MELRQMSLLFSFILLVNVVLSHDFFLFFTPSRGKTLTWQNTHFESRKYDTLPNSSNQNVTKIEVIGDRIIVFAVMILT